MRKLLTMSMVMGIGALGFAAVPQAGMTVRPDATEKGTQSRAAPVTRYVVAGCRIERTWKYDFHGEPYLKKVRVCA